MSETVPTEDQDTTLQISLEAVNGFPAHKVPVFPVQ